MRLQCQLCFILSLLLDGIRSMEDVLVSINQGTLRGMKEETLNGKTFFTFLGIPYAKPPLGTLRFKNPLPAEKWEGILDATMEPEYCLQPNMQNVMKGSQSEFQGKEDCLYLSIYTSKPMQLDAKLPVIVYIHGGGFMTGGSREYKPYVLLEEEIILVVIQYRLGALGFLSAGDEYLGGNYGLKDQTMALKWTKENIISFGGDPHRITLMGQSAGGIAAHLHMLSPWSKGLFHRVAAHSGTALFLPHSNKTLREEAETFGFWLGCSFDEGTEKFISCLQKFPPEEILRAGSKFQIWGAVPSPFVPIIDGDFLPDEPAKLMKEGKYNKADFISGITKDEGIVIVMMFFGNPKLIEELSQNFEVLGPISLYIEGEENALSIARNIYQYYLSDELSAKSVDELKELFTDLIFTVPHDLSISLLAKNPEINVYAFEFHHLGKLTLGDFIGVPEAKGVVAHGDDLIYFFSGGPILNKPLIDESDLRIRRLLTKMWTNFAATGNPTPDDSLGFQWKPVTESSKKHLRITSDPSMEEDQRTQVREFWLSLPLGSFAHIKEEGFAHSVKGEL